MAASNGDLLQFIDHQTYLGEDVLNIYYYRVVAIAGLTGNYLEQLNDEFYDTIVDNVRDFQDAGLVHTTIESRNLTNGIDFFLTSIVSPDGDGLTSGAGMPSAICYTFRLLRESLVTRNGYKRFAGVSESQGAGNAYTPSSGQIAGAIGGLTADLFLGAADVASPVIVKRPIPSPATVYEFSFVGDADFRGIGTQNTRKP